MSIQGFYNQGRPVVSLEVFPPKQDADIAEIRKAIGQIAALSPDFISVTYGAGGRGNSNRTVDIASFIQREHGVQALAHLTCIGAEREAVAHLLDDAKAAGLANVLALRGDGQPGMRPGNAYRFAEDLIADIRSRGDFCIGAACYAEGHIDCSDLRLDTVHLRRKQDAGADFLITQLFFDNDFFYRFLERARGGGVTLPISAGVMPILSRKQIERMIFLCGASLPSGIIKLLHKHENSAEDLRRAGIEYAAEQIEDLLRHGVDGVHIYAMNKPEIAEHCMKHIGRA